jgi:hypothetical protein
MRSSYLVITTVSVLAVLFFASSIDVNAGAYSFAAKADKHQSLSLTIQNYGLIASAGSQKWTMSGGVLGTAWDTATPALSSIKWNALTYSLTADVNGLTASGKFTLSLSGTSDGSSVTLRVHTTISGAVPAICFPSYTVPTTGTCASGDMSEIPAYFLANGYVRVHTGSDPSTKTPISLMIEDAALNPFGGPIVISSMDSSPTSPPTFLVVGTYDHARTVWQGVQTGGTLTGMFGSTPVSGSFVQTIHTQEDYVTGTATDSGQISLMGMNPTSLNANGKFHGTSTIPTTGTKDCSPLGLPGTCTETGYASTGTFSMDPSGVQVTGNYNVLWPAPSVVFNGTITGKVQ